MNSLKMGHEMTLRHKKLFIIFCLACAVCFFSGFSQADSDITIIYGEKQEKIKTLNGSIIWFGWNANFSENYIPSGEAYSKIVYIGGEGLYVALVKTRFVYSMVDTYLGVDGFYGVMHSPFGDYITEDYMDSLLGITFNLSIPSLPLFYTFDAGSHVGLSTFYQKGSSFASAIQASAGMSAGVSLIPGSSLIPLQVSLDRNDPEFNNFNGFWPFVIWTSSGAYSSTMPVDGIIERSMELANNSEEIVLVHHFLPPLITLLKQLKKNEPFSINNFIATKGRDPKIESIIKEVSEWKQTGETSNFPETVTTTLQTNTDTLIEFTKPIRLLTDLAFNIATKRARDAQGRTDIIDADCIVERDCPPGEICSIEVPAIEIANLLSGTKPQDFEGVSVCFDVPLDHLMTTGGTEKCIEIKNGKAIYEFTQTQEIPFLTGVRVWACDATEGKKVNLCFRKIMP